ncbi:hypothetical protein LCGC14_1661920 [marine sediment metagenome]|uniref:Uncharacterized protein n=1 Tax=marine sediment metagenome TaxID=412755 RepID=A0A0F9HTU8_9ZZZZ
MSSKCNSCGAKVIEYPIWKGQEFGEPFAFNKIKWKNLIIGDWIKLLILLSLVFAVWAYAHDTGECRVLLEKPCDFVMTNIRACEENRSMTNYLLPISEIPFEIKPVD